MTFGEKVKQARTELGLTQVQLGKILGVSQRTITAYETDTFPPRTRDAYCKLADALHVNVNYRRAIWVSRQKRCRSACW